MITSIVDTSFRLSSLMLAHPVDVRLRLVDGRWVAAAEIGGGTELGIGRTARQALGAALASLTVDQRRDLLADAALFAPSIAIQRAATSAT